MAFELQGWTMTTASEADWVPWGSGGKAQARVLASDDGFHVVLVRAEDGYGGDPHEHGAPEFLHVLSGTVRTQGVDLRAGDGYRAEPGSRHEDFVAVGPATYLSMFRL